MLLNRVAEFQNAILLFVVNLKNWNECVCVYERNIIIGKELYLYENEIVIVKSGALLKNK